MALQYSPKIVTDSLVMCLDPSHNKSYPTDLPVKNGLALWLDAADDSTFSYSSGTLVSQWRDKSGSNFHASQATVGSQPSRSTFQNSRKTVNFDGTNDTVTIPSFVSNSEMSIFVVSNCGTSMFIEQSIDTNFYDGFAISGIGTAMFIIRRSSITSYTFNTNWLSGGYSVASAVNSTGLDLLTYKNGTQQTIISDGRNSITNSYATNTLYIGSRAASSLWSSGPIAEIIIYNRKVTDTERNSIHTYLGQKWGISNTDRSIVDLSGFDDNGLLGNGTVANMPLYDYYNKGAFKFNSANNNYIKVGTNSSLQLNTLTISAFFKTINNAQSVQFIGGFGNTGAFGYFLAMANSPIMFSVGNGTTGNQLSSGITPNNDQIYHVVGTYDGVTQKIYVDGVLKNSATVVTGNLSYSGLTDGFLLGQAQSLDAGRYMSGNIYAMQVYNKALSAAEVLQNYEAQKSKFANTIVQQGLVLNLDAGNPYSYAGAGTTWYDTSGNNNYFQLTNSPSYVSAEPKNFSLASASSQHFLYYASIGSPTGSTGISLPSANSWTCAFWFKTSTNTTYNPFLSHMGSGPVYCLMGTTGTTLTYYHYNGGWLFKNATTNVLDNVWHQAVFVNTANTMIIYLDGIVEKSSFSSTVDNASNLVNGFGGSWTGTFSGNLSNFMYYNIALSAAQVLQNYNATKGRFGL